MVVLLEFKNYFPDFIYVRYLLLALCLYMLYNKPYLKRFSNFDQILFICEYFPLILKFSDWYLQFLKIKI